MQKIATPYNYNVTTMDTPFIFLKHAIKLNKAHHFQLFINKYLILFILWVTCANLCQAGTNRLNIYQKENKNEQNCYLLGLFFLPSKSKMISFHRGHAKLQWPFKPQAENLFLKKY